MNFIVTKIIDEKIKDWRELGLNRFDFINKYIFALMENTEYGYSSRVYKHSLEDNRACYNADLFGLDFQCNHMVYNEDY